MQVADRISAISNRAARINLTLWRLCKDAEVDYGNVHRWREGVVSPTVDRFEEAMVALESEITKRETQVIEALTPAIDRGRRRA